LPLKLTPAPPPLPPAPELTGALPVLPPQPEASNTNALINTKQAAGQAGERLTEKIGMRVTEEV
jgi:hypothetical protein